MMQASVELTPARDDILAARTRIGKYIRCTPLERSDALSSLAGHEVYLKLECWQPTRSFKVRGAFNALTLLDPTQRAAGVVTASAGNHGQAVALAARMLGVRAEIFVPATAPRVKQDRIRRLGAELRADEPDYDSAENAAIEYARRTGRPFVSGFSAEHVIAGAGTIGLEIVEDQPDIAAIVVPVGGGGLISGIGNAIRPTHPHVRMIGVQSTETRAMYESFRAGRAVEVAIPPTLADGLSGCTDLSTYERTRAVVDDLLLVEESAIAHAIRSLHADDGVVAEGSGAVGVAAMLSGALRLSGPTAFVVTGGNIDGAKLARVLAGGDR